MEQFKSLTELLRKFNTDESCRQYLEEQRWNGKPECPYCGNAEKTYKIESGKRYKCAKCLKKYSVTVGTVFEDTKIGLSTWFAAIYLATSHKKGISSLQLSRDLNCTQKTAWHMLHRIREMMKDTNPELLENHVEADETYIGGKNKNRHADKKLPHSQGRSSSDKTPVFGLVERNGRVVAMKVTDTKMKTIQPIIHNHVLQGANLMTDEYNSYNGLGKTYNHQRVNHGNGIYVTGLAHTNTMEGFWSLLKRGIIGIYHSVSVKHLDRYVEEFEFRYNTRQLSECGRFNQALTQSKGNLSYELLTNKS